MKYCACECGRLVVQEGQLTIAGHRVKRKRPYKYSNEDHSTRALRTSMHIWVKKHYGKPYMCERNKTHSGKRFYWSNPTGEYEKNRDNWMMICHSCKCFLSKKKLRDYLAVKETKIPRKVVKPVEEPDDYLL